MKRRDLLKGAICSAPLTLKVGDVFAQDDELVVGEDVLHSYDPVSHDITEFDININSLSRNIHIIPRNSEKPFLAVVALHRYLQDLADDAYGSDITLDIGYDNPSSRVTDDFIILENGWTVDDKSLPFLYGGLHRAGTNQYQCSVQLMGYMDPRLVKDLRIFDEHGNIFHQYKGVFNVPSGDPHTKLTLEYSAYQNFVPDSSTTKRDKWVRSVYKTEFSFGIVPVPIHATG